MGSKANVFLGHRQMDLHVQLLERSISSDKVRRRPDTALILSTFHFSPFARLSVFRITERGEDTLFFISSFSSLLATECVQF